MGYLNDIAFEHPIFLLMGVMPLAWYAWTLLGNRKYTSPIRMSSTAPYTNASSWRAKLGWLPDVLRLLGLLALIIALARPQLTLEEVVEKAEGIDIMLAIDLSSSMLAQDFAPDRLSVSKEVAIDFVRKRPHDRLGLSVFAGEAYTQCPLTTDQLILVDFLESLAVGTLEDGTAIGMGLATAIKRLTDSEAKSKIVILLTDGVNNTGYINPQTAADIAEEYGIKVYTIGVGSQGNAMTPVNRRSNGQYIFRNSRVQIDELMLQDISNSTGGKYFRATDRVALENIYAEIDRLEKTEIERNVFKRYQELFRRFLLLGLGLILLEVILRRTILNILS